MRANPFGLASLLWRLRRATTIETGLFEIQAGHLSKFRQAQQALPSSRVVHAMFGRADSISYNSNPASHGITNATEPAQISEPNPIATAVDHTVELTRCFLHLANLPNFALDRLNRYEATLWRQTGQILFALDALDRRKPQERKRRFNLYSLMIFSVRPSSNVAKQHDGSLNECKQFAARDRGRLKLEGRLRA
jgi:hypothetical protein